MMPTPDKPSLSRDDIVRTAVRISRQEGLAAVSARRLAVELGVTPMALYRHVDGMEDVAATVVDALLADEGLPQAAEDDWRAWLEELAQGLRRLIAAQPAVLDLFTQRAVTTPAACRRLSASIAVLTRAGFSPVAAEQAYAAVHTYTLGFCALAAARAEGQRRSTLRGTTARSPLGTAPEVATIEGFVSDQQFEHGLHALLRGLAPADGARPPA